MQWFGKGSNNVEDRRGGGGGRVAVGGGIGIIIVLVGLFFGKDLSGIANLVSTQPGAQISTGQGIDDEGKKFISGVLESTEQVWGPQFEELGLQYQQPKLILFTDAVESACGNATSAVGPFYCPGDNQVYIDLTFYDELKNRFGASGDFAQAYVIAHEVGHHVQNLLGTSAKLHAARGRVSEVEYNKLSVMLELQADFYAGLWAHHAKNLELFRLDADDIDEALTAANAIGDDKLQRESQGTVVPDAFTHGTSAQRMFWFKKGYETGDVKQGDTFNARKL